MKWSEFKKSKWYIGSIQVFILIIALIIQTIIEQKIETDYDEKLQNIINKLETESEIQSKRREVYTEIAQSMKIFLNGSGTPERIEKFYDDYSAMWLWANDITIKEINNFIDIMLEVTSKPGSIPQETMRSSYTKCMLAMRKEIFPDTELNDDDFQFLKFGRY